MYWDEVRRHEALSVGQPDKCNFMDRDKLPTTWPATTHSHRFSNLTEVSLPLITSNSRKMQPRCVNCCNNTSSQRKRFVPSSVHKPGDRALSRTDGLRRAAEESVVVDVSGTKETREPHNSEEAMK